MTATLDGRPAGLDAFFRPGKTFAHTLTWTAGYLAGRTWLATIDGEAIGVDVTGDDMVISITDEQTETFGVGRHEFELADTSSGEPETTVIGIWAGSRLAATSARTAVDVRIAEGASIDVNVSVAAHDPAIAARVDAVETTVDTVETTVTALGTDVATVETAVDDVDTRVAAIEALRPVIGPYVDAPSGFGRRWYPARAAAEAGSALARVVHMGDSIAVGWRASPTWFSGYGTLLGNGLRAEYGDGGPGFIGVDFARHTGNNLVPGNPVPVSANTAWTTQVSDALSINAHSVRPTVDGSGATMTFTVDCGSSLTIYSRTDPTYGRYDYRIDGGAAVQVPQNLAAAVQATVVPVTPGVHTVQIIAAAGTCRMLGVKSEKTSGVAYHNMSVAGRQIDDVPTSSFALNSTFAATGVPDLFVLSLGVNDCNVAGRTQAEIEGWLNTIFQHVLGLDTLNPPDLAVVIQHRGNIVFGDINGVWPGVYSGLRRAAERYGAAVIDMWAIGRRSWDYWESLGYWNPGGDAVHPSNAGHAFYSDVVLAALTA